MFSRYPCIAVSFFSRFVRITTVIVRLRKGVRKQRDGKQRRVKIQSIIQYFQRGWQATKTGNPQNQRIDGWYDNAPRILANQLCALSLGEQSTANEARTEPEPPPPPVHPLRFFFSSYSCSSSPPPSRPSPLAGLLFVLLLFVLQTQLVQSTLVVRADGGL